MNRSADSEDVNALSSSISKAFQSADVVLPTIGAQQRRPWIRHVTLDLIDLRFAARGRGDAVEEVRLKMEVHKSVRKDRRAWLDDLAGSGVWAKLRALKRGTRHNQGQLADDTDELVSSDLEQVQWAVRPATLVDRLNLFTELPLSPGAVRCRSLNPPPELAVLLNVTTSLATRSQ